MKNARDFRNHQSNTNSATTYGEISNMKTARVFANHKPLKNTNPATTYGEISNTKNARGSYCSV
jgi:hypothetical protein